MYISVREPLPVAATAADTNAVVSSPKKPLRILLVDDHMLVRAGLRSVLEGRTDMEVVGEASSGEEAYDLTERLRPDLVIMDLDMPGDGGLATTRRLTARDPKIAVLILTMYAERDRLVEALRAGARGYLTKDLASHELLGAIHSAAKGDVYVRPQATSVLAASLGRTPVEEPDTTQVARSRFNSLSAREQAVLRLVAEGYTGREIGDLLGITAKTVDTYRHRIQEKIGLTHRTEYIRFALSIDLMKK
jgi:DNA-binding NarL/FixJ family response regulator